MLHCGFQLQTLGSIYPPSSTPHPGIHGFKAPLSVLKQAFTFRHSLSLSRRSQRQNLQTSIDDHGPTIFPKHGHQKTDLGTLQPYSGRDCRYTLTKRKVILSMARLWYSIFFSRLFSLGLQPYPQKVVRPPWHPPQPPNLRRLLEP